MARTNRKSYTKSKSFDRSCRNHGSCGYCQDNRTWFDTKQRASTSVKEGLSDYLDKEEEYTKE